MSIQATIPRQHRNIASNHTLFTRSNRCVTFSDKQYCWPAKTVQMNFGKQYGLNFAKDHLSEFVSVFFKENLFAVHMDYHVPFLRIIFCCIPLDFVGLGTRSQEP